MRPLQGICTIWLQVFVKISFFSRMILRIGLDSTTQEINETVNCLTITIRESQNFVELKIYSPAKKVDF